MKRAEWKTAAAVGMTRRVPVRTMTQILRQKIEPYFSSSDVPEKKGFILADPLTLSLAAATVVAHTTGAVTPPPGSAHIVAASAAES